MVNWLSQVNVPLFISTRRLERLKSLPRPIGQWALDSGAFTELDKYGRFSTSASEYATRVRRYQNEMGNLDWAAPQDYMCEPWILAKTGLTVRQHQDRTINSVILLRTIAADLPFIPVLQGWQLSDYHRHVEMYASRGIDLHDENLVGLGSVCRRQSTAQISQLIAELAGEGLNLHGFGVKTRGLRVYARNLASADSMAWSYNARRNPPIPGHTHKACNNCLIWALRWRSRVLEEL